MKEVTSKVFTMIGHDGNFNGHEEVGGSAVERQCAPAAHTETMKVIGLSLLYQFIADQKIKMISVTYTACEPAVKFWPLCGSFTALTASVISSGSALRRK